MPASNGLALAAKVLGQGLFHLGSRLARHGVQVRGQFLQQPDPHGGESHTKIARQKYCMVWTFLVQSAPS